MQEIPPYETKTVMKANFVGRVENNHTAFIRIKTNQEQTNNLVILPVEVEVSSGEWKECFLELRNGYFRSMLFSSLHQQTTFVKTLCFPSRMI